MIYLDVHNVFIAFTPSIIISSVLFVYPDALLLTLFPYSTDDFDVDENGVQHILLCRVIMGNMELIHPESDQFHPSNKNYDSGVDDLQNPKHYVIWDTHMNSHIYPEYIVSFRAPPRAKGNLYNALVLFLLLSLLLLMNNL